MGMAYEPGLLVKSGYIASSFVYFLPDSAVYLVDCDKHEIGKVGFTWMHIRKYVFLHEQYPSQESSKIPTFKTFSCSCEVPKNQSDPAGERESRK